MKNIIKSISLFYRLCFLCTVMGVLTFLSLETSLTLTKFNLINSLHIFHKYLFTILTSVLYDKHFIIICHVLMYETNILPIDQYGNLYHVLKWFCRYLSNLYWYMKNFQITKFTNVIVTTVFNKTDNMKAKLMNGGWEQHEYICYWRNKLFV